MEPVIENLYRTYFEHKMFRLNEESEAEYLPLESHLIKIFRLFIKYQSCQLDVKSLL